MPEFEGAKLPVPDGCYPLFLTMTTQQHYNCIEKEHVTAEKPYVMVPKETFIAEIRFKGAISDFFVVKKQIEKFKGDELAIVWDEEEDYGQNYYLIFTQSAIDSFHLKMAELQAIAKAKLPAGRGLGGAAADISGQLAETYIEEVYLAPVSKPWVSRGSEAEIAEESVVPQRELFVLALARKRREFATPYKFSDRDAQEDPNIQQNDCRPYKDPNFELRRNEHQLGTQAVPEKAQAKTQTTWFRPVNKALEYQPITMCVRQAGKLLDSAAMREFLATVRPRYEEALQQNETVRPLKVEPDARLCGLLHLVAARQ